jgi:hypothetical protein
MGLMTSSAHMRPARRRFAALFKRLLSKEESPTRPNQGWTPSSLSLAIGMSRQIVGFWCVGSAIPHTEETLERVIRALFGRHDGYEIKKKDLRLYWHLAKQESDKEKWNASKANDDVRQSTETLRRILLPYHAGSGAGAWRVENIVELISRRQLTSQATTQIVDSIKRLPRDEKNKFTKVLGQILLEKSSSDADERVREVVASVLSKYFSWRPAEDEMKALMDMSRATLAASWATIDVASPLSVALARAGCSDILRLTISRLITDRECGRNNFDVVEKFYGNEFLQFDRIMDHFRDHNRSGLIWANDTNTLLMLVDSQTLPTECKMEIKPKLLLCAKLLHDTGLEKEARQTEKKAREIS